MTDIEARTTIEPEGVPRRSRAWWVVAVLAVVGVAVAGTALLAEQTGPENAVETVGQESDAEVTVDEEAVLGELVLAIMDDSLTVDERVALVHDPAQEDPSAHALLSSIDGLASRAGVTDARVVGTRVIGDAALVDVELTLDGRLGTGAHLSSFVARRVDGSWLLTRETLCGLAQQASTVGAATTCTGIERIRHAETEVPMADLLVGAAGTIVDATAATALETGWWNAELVGVGDDWWFLDYPEEELGGGGPVGPAHLVRVDGAGVETARIELAGTDARLVGGDGLVWVLQYVTDPDLADGAGAGSSELVAVETRSAQVLTSTPVGPFELPVASNGVDVFVVEGGSLHRYDGRTLQRVATTDLGMVASGDLVTATDEDIWFGDSAGRAAVVSMDGLAVERRSVPDGHIVGSGDQVWSARSSGGSTTVEPIEPAGGASPRTLDGVRLNSAWADGEGGLWVVGDAAASSTTAIGLDMPVVSRPMALHVRRDGTIDQTWWLEGSHGSTSGWFLPAGDGLARAGASGVTLLSYRGFGG